MPWGIWSVILTAAALLIMAKYVDVEQVCLWLQPLNDRVIAMIGEASESQCRIQKQLAKVVQSHYKSGELEQEYDGNYLIQVSQENYNLEAFVFVSQSLLTATQKTLIRTLLIIMGAMILAIMVIVLFVSQWMTKPVVQPGERPRRKGRQLLQQGQRHAPPGGQLERAFTLAHHHAVFTQTPLQAFVVRLAEQVFVMDLHRQRLATLQGQNKGLLGTPGFKQGGIRNE